MIKIGILISCQRKPTLLKRIYPTISLLHTDNASPYLIAEIPQLRSSKRMEKLIARGIQFLHAKGAETVLLSKEFEEYDTEKTSSIRGIPPGAICDLLHSLLPILCREKIFQYIHVIDKTGEYLTLSLLELLHQYGKYLSIHSIENYKLRKLEASVLEKWGLLLDIDLQMDAPSHGSSRLVIDFDQGIVWAGRDLKITGIELDIPLPDIGKISTEQLLPLFLPEYQAYRIKYVYIGKHKIPLSTLCTALKNEVEPKKKTC